MRRASARQLSLADADAIYAPYVPESATSKAAADSVRHDLGRLEGVILDLLRAAGDLGHTDDELEVLTGLTHQCVSARRRGLVLRGRVEETDRTRLTRHGRRATVWAAIDDSAERGEHVQSPPVAGEKG